MNASRWISSTLALALLGACSKGPATPAEQMSAADEARNAGDHAKALELYGSLTDWKGEGAVGEGDRFKASLESVKCRIAMGEAAPAVEAYKKMFESFPKAMNGDGSYKNTLAVLSSLLDKKADPMVSIDLLELAKNKHAAQQANFAKLVKKLESQGLDSAAMEKLKSLGYL